MVLICQGLSHHHALQLHPTNLSVGRQPVFGLEQPLATSSQAAFGEYEGQSPIAFLEDLFLQDFGNHPLRCQLAPGDKVQVRA